MDKELIEDKLTKKNDDHLILPKINTKNSNVFSQKFSSGTENPVSLNKIKILQYNIKYIINIQTSIIIREAEVHIDGQTEATPHKVRKIRKKIKLPKLKSPNYDQVLNTEDMEYLAKDYLRENNNIFSYIKKKNRRLLKKINKRLETVEPDNPLGNEIQEMVKLHSCKFHSPKEEKNKSLIEEFDEEMKMLKSPKKKMPWDINNNKKKNEIINEDNIMRYRKRMAFRYRFMSENKKIKNNKKSKKNIIAKNNEKMNRLLKISKSIPNFLRDALNSESDLNKKNKGYEAAIQSEKISNMEDKSITNMSPIDSEKDVYDNFEPSYDNDNYNENNLYNNPNLHKDYFKMIYNSVDYFDNYNEHQKEDFTNKNIDRIITYNDDNTDIFKITKLNYPYSVKLPNQRKTKSNNKYMKPKKPINGRYINDLNLLLSQEKFNTYFEIILSIKMQL